MASYVRFCVYCVLIISAVCVFIIPQTCANEDGVHSTPKCPGLYCGRIYDDTTKNLSACGACPRGFHPGDDSVCQRCDGSPTFYDWLYLGFMALMAPILHWFFIDFTNKKKAPPLLVLHVCAFVESLLAAVCTLLVLEPRGSLTLTSCPVKLLSDWYTMLYNPRPGYMHTLHCTQEIVYPLYTIVMIYYAFGLVFMMLLRPFISTKFVSHRGTKSIYAALYFFPILVVAQAVLAGILYYFFPYIVLVMSIITSATHFAFYQGTDLKSLVVETTSSPRRVVILVCHWLLHAYSIIAITQMTHPVLHGAMIALVPFPALFYVLTVQYTDPERLESF